MSATYFQEHLSLSEWLINANVRNRDQFVREDATKRTRLNLLHEMIGLPIISTTTLTARDIIDRSDAYQALLSNAGDTPYAVRAIPKAEGLPVLRNRKLAVRDLVTWLLSLVDDLTRYDLSFEIHIDPKAASLFVVGPERVLGEAAHGGILQLNKGSQPDSKCLRFEFDYQGWRFSRADDEIEAFVRTAVELVHVDNEGGRSEVEKTMSSSFTSEYLQGYFEVISSSQHGLVFIDYNRELSRNTQELRMTAAVTSNNGPDRTLRGQAACSGVVRGPARVLREDDVDEPNIKPGQILVCHFTLPSFLPLIMQAAAVITDVGGVLSHAAIVCRELHKPCIVGVKTATSVINEDDEIEVDGGQGVIRVFGAHDG